MSLCSASLLVQKQFPVESVDAGVGHGGEGGLGYPPGPGRGRSRGAGHGAQAGGGQGGARHQGHRGHAAGGGATRPAHPGARGGGAPATEQLILLNHLLEHGHTAVRHLQRTSMLIMGKTSSNMT